MISVFSKVTRRTNLSYTSVMNLKFKKKIVQPMLSNVFKIDVKIRNVSSINCVVPENTHAPHSCMKREG